MVAVAAAAMTVIAASLSPVAASVTASTAVAGTSGLSTRTFESDPVGSVPAGCATPSGWAPAAVSDQRAFQGTRSLEVNDTSSSSVVAVNCPAPAQQGAYLSFELYPAALPHGVEVDLDGSAHDPTGLDGDAVFHVDIAADGGLQWYDGSSWHALAPAGTVPTGQWSQVQLEVSADDTAVYATVNGTYVGSGNAATPVTAITGYGFASSGTEFTGDDAFFDNVSFGPLTAIPSGTPVSDSFESDAVGSVPAGCATPSGHASASVSDERAYQGAQSLRLDDTSSSSQVAVTCSAAPQQGAYLSLEIYPAALPNGFGFDIDGDTLTSTSLSPSVFHFAVDANGDIRWDEAGTFRPLAPAGTIPTGQWSHVEVAVLADNSAAHITVNGTYVGSAGPFFGDNGSSHNALTAITGYGITSYGASYTGDDVFIDNTTFGPAADTPASAVGTPPLQVGATSEIDDVGQVQLPTSDLVVPHGNGQRILAEYPAHSDSSVTTGNRLAYSDDGGTTWVDDQAANPMPDVPSFFMTRLRDGDILAVNYHTYMTPDSGDLQAEVDTALSHDGGQTWTLRTGTMTAPQAMRSLGTSERPDSPLGGFVLVHPVVEDPDGTLYQSAYGEYGVDQAYRNLLLVSHDGGLNWTVQGTVATADPAKVGTSGYEGPCEGAIDRTADGSMLMVMRTGSYLPMIYSRSTDNGKTWSAPQQVATGPAAQPLYSVFPTMELLPTGELVLLAGRPGLVMAVSMDGLGDDWSTPVGIDYVNSENSAYTPLDPSTVLVLGDRGRVSPWQVWMRSVTIDQPCAQTVTGTYNGPLSAGSGGLCLDNATVSGPVTVTGGGRLIVQGSTIHGPVSTTGASVVSLCGSQIDGAVSFSGDSGNVTIGDTTRGCDPDTIDGPLSVTGTSGRLVADRTTVTGPVTVTGIGSGLAAVLAGMTVNGPLSCSGNAMTPTDSGVADSNSGPSSGQCAGLG